MLTACSSGAVITARQTPEYRPQTYHTVSLSDAPTAGRGSLAPETDQAVRENILGQLRAKNWGFVDVRGADLVFSWGLGPADFDARAEVDENTLVVDVFERQTGARVWFGYGPCPPGAEAEEVVALVDRILFRFPGAGARPVAY